MDAIICGTRTATMMQTLTAIRTCPFISSVNRVVSGKQKKKQGAMVLGADYWGEWWAKCHDFDIVPFEAKWHDFVGQRSQLKYNAMGQPYNAAAGPVRSERMVDFVKATGGGLIAAWDGISHGAEHAIFYALQSKLAYVHVWCYSEIMRNMSFAMTTKQMRERAKTVTRRVGWWGLRPGQRVRAVEKAMGLKRGEKQKPLGTIEVVSTRFEEVQEITVEDVAKEGFPQMSKAAFVEFFCRTHRCQPETVINRIEFKHLQGGE